MCSPSSLTMLHKFITFVFIAGFSQENVTALSYPLKDSGTVGNLNSSRVHVLGGFENGLQSSDRTNEHKTSFPKVPEFVTQLYPSHTGKGETFKGKKSITTHFLKGKGKDLVILAQTMFLCFFKMASVYV